MDDDARETGARMAAYMQHRLGNLYTGMRMIVDAVPCAGHPVPPTLAPRLALAANELERTRAFSVRLGQAFGPLPTPAPSFLADSLVRCCGDFEARHGAILVRRTGFDAGEGEACHWANCVELALSELMQNAAQNLWGSAEIELELRVTSTGRHISVHQEGEWPGDIPITPPLPFLSKRDGAGLGLTIAYRCVDAMGGSLALCSERPETVTVRMSLPPEAVNA